MRPTSWRVLLVLLLVGGAAGWLVADRAYGAYGALPGYAPVTAVAIALAELALAREVWLDVGRRSRRRPLDALQVARAAALAKATSSAGALLAGLYGGFFGWTFPRRDELAAAGGDARVAGLSAAAAVLMLVAALVLERCCRTPAPPDEPDW